jgi:hypothetical protein
MGYNFFTSIYYLLCLSINYVIKRFNDWYINFSINNNILNFFIKKT